MVGPLWLTIASLGLVFAGQHVLANAPLLTGGYNGRTVTNFDLFGFAFDSPLAFLDKP